MSTKELIFNASLELFAQSGYDATTVRKIVAKVGITEGAFYNHYASKQDVLKGIFDTCDDFYRRACPPIDELRKMAAEQSLTEILYGILKKSPGLSETTTNKLLWQVIISEQHRNSYARKILLDHKQRRIDGFITILEAYQQQGKVVTCDARIVATVYSHSLFDQHTDYMASMFHQADGLPFIDSIYQTIDFLVRTYECNQ